eukprot:1629817-Rhodomonas_salina.2
MKLLRSGRLSAGDLQVGDQVQNLQGSESCRRADLRRKGCKMVSRLRLTRDTQSQSSLVEDNRQGFIQKHTHSAGPVSSLRKQIQRRNKADQSLCSASSARSRNRICNKVWPHSLAKGSCQLQVEPSS